MALAEGASTTAQARLKDARRFTGGNLDAEAIADLQAVERVDKRPAGFHVRTWEFLILQDLDFLVCHLVSIR